MLHRYSRNLSIMASQTARGTVDCTYGTTRDLHLLRTSIQYPPDLSRRPIRQVGNDGIGVWDGLTKRGAHGVIHELLSPPLAATKPLLSRSLTLVS
jgi:hypothetical protein